MIIQLFDLFFFDNIITTMRFRLIDRESYLFPRNEQQQHFRGLRALI